MKRVSQRLKTIIQFQCSIDAIEAMLELADYFECTSVIRLMEKKLLEKWDRRFEDCDYGEYSDEEQEEDGEVSSCYNFSQGRSK